VPTRDSATSGREPAEQAVALRQRRACKHDPTWAHLPWVFVLDAQEGAARSRSCSVQFTRAERRLVDLLRVAEGGILLRRARMFLRDAAHACDRSDRRRAPPRRSRAPSAT